MAYSNKVIDHYNNPRNVGTLDKGSNDVGTGLVGAPECGDVMRLQIKVNPKPNSKNAIAATCVTTTFVFKKDVAAAAHGAPAPAATGGGK